MTQRCGYKSAAPLAGFVQFIAHFNRAFVLIDSLPHTTRAFVVGVWRSVHSFSALTCQVHFCVCFFVVFFPHRAPWLLWLTTIVAVYLKMEMKKIFSLRLKPPLALPRSARGFVCVVE